MDWRSVAALLEVVIVLILEFQPMIPPEQMQWSGISPASVGSVDESHRLTITQPELLDWAKDRLRRAGLEFPDVDIRFHPDLMECDGHMGLFNRASNSLDMCRIDKRWILHELAHAWVHSNLTDRQRSEFTALRGLEV